MQFYIEIFVSLDPKEAAEFMEKIKEKVYKLVPSIQMSWTPSSFE